MKLAIVGIIAFLCALVLAGLCSAQDIESLKSTLRAKQCPPAAYPHINVFEKCNSREEAKACDQKYPPASVAWQNCYHDIDVCWKKVDADNEVINESNRIFRGCHRDNSADSRSSPSTAKASPTGPSSSDLESSIKDAKAKNAARESAARVERENVLNDEREAIQKRKTEIDQENKRLEEDRRRLNDDLAIQEQRKARIRAQLEAEQKNKQSAIGQSADWKCFSDYVSCTAYCRQVNGLATNGPWCGGICSDNAARERRLEINGTNCYFPR
jgi:hypothetical protein